MAGKAGARAQENAYAEQAAQVDQEARLAALEQQAAPVAAPPPTGGSDLVAELTKLKGLLDAGVLNQREFDSAKQRVLAGG